MTADEVLTRIAEITAEVSELTSSQEELWQERRGLYLEGDQLGVPRKAMAAAAGGIDPVNICKGVAKERSRLVAQVTDPIPTFAEVTDPDPAYLTPVDDVASAGVSEG